MTTTEEPDAGPLYTTTKEDQLIIVGAFFEDLELWQSVLDDCALQGVAMVQQYLSHNGSWVCFQLQIGGDWHQLAKIESGLKARKKALTTETLDWKRDVFRLDDIIRMPYSFEANSVINIALFDLLIHFIRAEKQIEIKEVWTDRYLQGKTAVPMQRLRILVYIPMDVNLPELRENFMLFCEQYNLDGLFELERS